MGYLGDLLSRVIQELGPWSWWILGLILLGLEILAPGSVFIWFGVGAILVGVVALVTPLTWQVAVALFLVLSLISLVVGRRLVSRVGTSGGDPLLNQRGSRYVGRVFRLAEPLEHGSGHLSIDDTVWRITGPDLPAGVEVRVDAVIGAKLAVSPLASDD